MSKERVQLEAVEEPVKVRDDEPISDITEAEPRFVYDVIMANMTVDKLAEMGVRLIYVNNSDLFWVTSAGQLYTFNDRTRAIEAEYNWLRSRV